MAESKMNGFLSVPSATLCFQDSHVFDDMTTISTKLRSLAASISDEFRYAVPSFPEALAKLILTFSAEDHSSMATVLVTCLIECSKGPQQRQDKIEWMVNLNKCKDDFFIKDFVGSGLVSIEARVLPFPEFMYGHGHNSACQPIVVGAWQLSNRKMVMCGNIDYWTSVTFMNADYGSVCRIVVDSHCKEMLSLSSPLNEVTISRIVSTIAGTHSGIEDSQNIYSTFCSAFGAGSVTDASSWSSWNTSVLDTFPLHVICESVWNNSEGQLSFFRYAVSAPPEMFTFAHSSRNLSVICSQHGSNIPSVYANETWLCPDLREVLCQLAERGHAVEKTGSGKTLGYLFPGFIHLQCLQKNNQMGPTMLVLSPTRELATQIQDEAVKFGSASSLSCTCLYDGAPTGPQLLDLDRGTDVVAATPGRLNDILELKRHVQVLVDDNLLETTFPQDPKAMLQEQNSISDRIYVVSKFAMKTGTSDNTIELMSQHVGFVKSADAKGQTV